jgi:hypothetical protein
MEMKDSLKQSRRPIPGQPLSQSAGGVRAGFEPLARETSERASPLMPTLALMHAMPPWLPPVASPIRLQANGG